MLQADHHVSAVSDLTVVVPCYNERQNVAILVSRLADALAGIAWEVVFVDDNSPDGTAEEAKSIAAVDPRVRCIRRVGRRGLSSAVIEGVLSSASPYVAVIDGDLQHDETRLPAMLQMLRDGKADVVVASRFAAGGDAEGLADARRLALSNLGIRLAVFMLGTKLTDPMSGYFVMQRRDFEVITPRLTGNGFKILLDLLLSSPKKLRVQEVGAVFRARMHGESKLSPLVMLQFLALLLDKATNGLVPLRFISFALVGAFGVVVHLAVLQLGTGLGLHFLRAQTVATLVAMVANFQLNNVITYRDQRLRGARVWRDCSCSCWSAASAPSPISASPGTLCRGRGDHTGRCQSARLSAWSGITRCRRLSYGIAAVAGAVREASPIPRR